MTLGIFHPSFFIIFFFKTKKTEKLSSFFNRPAAPSTVLLPQAPDPPSPRLPCQHPKSTIISIIIYTPCFFLLVLYKEQRQKKNKTKKTPPTFSDYYYFLFLFPHSLFAPPWFPMTTTMTTNENKSLVSRAAPNQYRTYFLLRPLSPRFRLPANELQKKKKQKTDENRKRGSKTLRLRNGKRDVSVTRYVENQNQHRR